jgi:hypothetical protein
MQIRPFEMPVLPYFIPYIFIKTGYFLQSGKKTGTEKTALEITYQIDYLIVTNKIE